MIGYFFLCMLALGVSADQGALDSAVDQLLKETQSVLRNEGGDKVALSPVNHPFKFEFMGRVLPGVLTADSGVIEGLSSLKRSGNSHIITGGSFETIWIKLQFDNLRMNYGTSKYKYLKFESSGALHLSELLNEATVNISVLRDGSHCSLNIENMSIDNISQGKFKQEGKQLPEQFEHNIQKYLIQDFFNNDVEHVESVIRNALSKSLAHSDLCKAI